MFFQNMLGHPFAAPMIDGKTIQVIKKEDTPIVHVLPLDEELSVPVGRTLSPICAADVLILSLLLVFIYRFVWYDPTPTEYLFHTILWHCLKFKSWLQEKERFGLML